MNLDIVSSKLNELKQFTLTVNQSEYCSFSDVSGMKKKTLRHVPAQLGVST